VHTPFYDVKVLGTQFNVKAYKTDTEIVTTLEEGSVQIASSENFKMAENKTLHPGEQLVYNRQNKTINVKDVETRMFTAWKDNKLIFINMNLKELIVLLERKYGVEIEITDNMILNYHYDGTIKDETILEVLDLLKETLPIKYKIEGQTILITKK
jgi:transmembrane sensor